MDGIGARKSLANNVPHDSKRSSCVTFLTDEGVRATVTPSTESWIQDVLCPDLWLQLCPTGGSNFFYGPSQKNGQSILKFVGSSMDYTVGDARSKAEWLAKRIPLGTIQRKLRRSMRIENVVIEYLQETDPNTPDLLMAFFDCHLVPEYGPYWLSGIDKERWLSLIKQASKDQPNSCKLLHRHINRFLGWAVSRHLLRRNPLSGTRVAKSPSLAGSDGADRLLRLFAKPIVPD